MSIKNGNISISKIYKGQSLISGVYAGESKVFPDNAFEKFLENLRNTGGKEDMAKECFSKIPDVIKKRSSVILFPAHSDSNKVYAMDNKNGDLLPICMYRGSQATFFDKNLNLHLSAADTPRIDYLNYSDSPKILLEKQSTNVIARTLTQSGLQISNTDESCFGFENYVRLTKNSGSGYLSSRYSVSRSSVPNGESCTVSFVAKKNSNGDAVAPASYNANSDRYDLPTVAVKHFGSGEITTLEPSLLQIQGLDENPSKFSLNNNVLSGTFELILYPGLININELHSVDIAMIQMEMSTNIATSYIPISQMGNTRAADRMIINLLKDCEVYIKTVKEEKYMDKAAGVWNVHDDITESDGLLALAILGNDAFDKNYPPSIFVDETPKMTWARTPAPYFVWTSSVYNNNNAFQVWHAFQDKVAENSRWASANTYDSEGKCIIAEIPYIYLQLGTTIDTAKRYSRLDVSCYRQTSVPYIDAPRKITIKYSNDNINYTEFTFDNLTQDEWETANGKLSFYFDKPDTPQIYWILQVHETNGHPNASISNLTYFVDINN